MSLKLDLFAHANPAPRTLDKFVVLLPGLKQAAIKVSAASLPFPTQNEGAVWFLGRPIYLPTWKDLSGTWTCIYVEDMALSGTSAVSSLLRRISNRHVHMDNIVIYQLDQITGAVPQTCFTLKNAWLKEVRAKDLDWSKPTDYQAYTLTFRFNGLMRWY